MSPGSTIVLQLKRRRRWRPRPRRLNRTHRRRVNHHGGVDAEPTRRGRRRRRFRAAVPAAVYPSRAPVLVQGVPVVYRVLLRVRVLLRDVRAGPQRYRSSHVAQSRRQMVVEMRIRVELGKSNV